VRTGRHFVGYDTDPSYVKRALERVADDRERGRVEGPTFAVPAARPAGGVPAGEDRATRALREGLAAKEVAYSLLEDLGFTAIESPGKVRPGLEVTFRARDARDRPWLFEVWGGFTTSRPGLSRTEVLWRALGRAAVVHEIEAAVPLVLLTTDLPARASANARALRTMTGPGKPIAGVFDLASAAARAELRSLVDT